MKASFFLTFLVSVLLCCAATADTPAPSHATEELIYATHSRTHKLIAVRGLVFRAHDGIFYSQAQKNNRHVVLALHLVPGQPDAATEEVAEIHYPKTETTAGERIYPSHTHRWEWNEDGGNMYIYDEKSEDAATEVEVKNLPPGYSIRKSAAVPHEGKLLLILKEDATDECSYAFLDIATGTLSEKRYPGAKAEASLIWRGGNLVWQIYTGRMCTVFDIYDLEQEKYLVKDGTCAAYYYCITPMNRTLIGIKANDDVDIITPLDPKQIVADAPAPRDATLYGIPEQPGDTILCAPGKVYTAGENTFYVTDEQCVYEVSIIRRTHMMEKPVFPMDKYVACAPGERNIISHRYKYDVSPYGGDAILMPKESAATPLRVKNLPSGYVIDACAAVPCEGKLALHLTHAAEDKCAYALLNPDTATIEGPLHPAPVSRPASLIQRRADIIWEISQQRKNTDIPISAYDLRLNKRVFEQEINSPDGICILGDTAVELTIRALLNPLYTLRDMAPTDDIVYIADDGKIAQLPGKHFLADGHRLYLAEITHHDTASPGEGADVPQIAGVWVRPHTLQNGQLVQDGEPTYVPVTPDVPEPDAQRIQYYENRIVAQRCGDVHITPMTREYYAPKLDIPNMPENCRVIECTPAPVNGLIIAMLENNKTHERYFSKLDVNTGMLVGELCPGAESCTHFMIWRGGDTIHQVTPHTQGNYRTYSLSKKAYTTPLQELPSVQKVLLHNDRLWDAALPQESAHSPH